MRDTPYPLPTLVPPAVVLIAPCLLPPCAWLSHLTHPGALRELTALQELYLYSNRLTALPANTFANLTALSTLDVSQVLPCATAVVPCPPHPCDLFLARGISVIVYGVVD